MAGINDNLVGKYIEATTNSGTIIGVLREVQEPDYYIINRDGGSIYYLPIQNITKMVIVERKKISAVDNPWNQPITIVGQ